MHLHRVFSYEVVLVDDDDDDDDAYKYHVSSDLIGSHLFTEGVPMVTRYVVCIAYQAI